MTRPGDPKGYYACLGVADWATPKAIDAAFQARSRELHPDRNPSPDAARRYQQVLEAHALLSDERRRRAYDAEGRTVDGTGSEAEAEAEEPAAPQSEPAADGGRWFRRTPVVAGVVVAAALAVAVLVVVRAPPQISGFPARALTPPTMPVPHRFERRVVTATGVNLRMGPGMQHVPTARIARGESVDMLEPEADGWIRVRLDDGRTGYVAARFLAVP